MKKIKVFVSILLFALCTCFTLSPISAQFVDQDSLSAAIDAACPCASGEEETDEDPSAKGEDETNETFKPKKCIKQLKSLKKALKPFGFFGLVEKPDKSLLREKLKACKKDKKGNKGDKDKPGEDKPKDDEKPEGDKPEGDKPPKGDKPEDK